MSRTHRLQANLNSLSDDDLKAFLFYNYHHVKDIEAARQNDPQVLRLKEQIRELEAPYNADIRDCTNNVKAARALCEVRGLKFDGTIK